MELADSLLKFGAAVNSKHGMSSPALQMAIANRHEEIAKLLLSTGAKADGKALVEGTETTVRRL